MCKKGTFFTREEYHQLIYGALRTEEGYCSTKRIRTLPPTIWKPKPLWCGKQLVSLTFAFFEASSRLSKSFAD